MGVVSFREEFVSPVSATRFFKAAVLDGPHLFAKLYPHILESATFIKGDGEARTIRQYNFTKSSYYTSYQEFHYEIDEENFSNKYKLIAGGDLGTKLESYDAFLKLEPLSEGGCIIKFGVEYKTLDGVDYTKEMKYDRDEIQIYGYKHTADYLIANPEAYA